MVEKPIEQAQSSSTKTESWLPSEKPQMEQKFHTKVEYCGMAKGTHGKCNCGEDCRCGPDCDCCKDYSSDK